MNQTNKRIFLIKKLLDESPQYDAVTIPHDAWEQKRLLRALVNVRPPRPASREFLAAQDEYLREELAMKAVVDIADLPSVEEGIYLWKGDITTLRCDAIVNAANSGLTGCYVPCHNCIDNCIHTFAGVQLRQACAELMTAQGHEEPTGQAKITRGYNLPCKYVLHTVGPIIEGPVRREDREALASCYRSCLELAAEHGLASIAFCCISTGVFHFPNREAAEIAVNTVRGFLRQKTAIEKVIFNVFQDQDKQIYQELLCGN